MKTNYILLILCTFLGSFVEANNNDGQEKASSSPEEINKSNLQRLEALLRENLKNNNIKAEKISTVKHLLKEIDGIKRNPQELASEYIAALIKLIETQVSTILVNPLKK